MTSWLNKQKKDDVVELASTAGYQADSSKKKADLIVELDEYLQKNATTLEGQTAFAPYYGTRRVSRPRESIGNITSDVEGEVKSAVRKTVKKATKAKADVENTAANFLASPGKFLSDTASRISSPFTSALARTPPVSRRVSSMNAALQQSTGEVAEEIERATTKFYAGAGDLYSVSGIPDTVEWFRHTCSSVAGIQFSILLLEAYALQKQVLPWMFVFALPSVPALSIPSINVEVPDIFVLGRGSFWGPTVLWSLTSIILPLFFAYFYNLTLQPVKRRTQRYPADPVTFSIAKAIIALLVYGAHAPYDYVNVFSASVVDHAMIGGYRGVILGCIVTGISAIWEAAQR